MYFLSKFCKGSVIVCQQRLSSLLTPLTSEFFVNSSIGLWNFSKNNPLRNLTTAYEVMAVFQLLFSLATSIYLQRPRGACLQLSVLYCWTLPILHPLKWFHIHYLREVSSQFTPLFHLCLPFKKRMTFPHFPASNGWSFSRPMKVML